MKKSLLLIATTTILFSCKKEDNGCSKNVENISGTYKVTAITYKAGSSLPEEDYYNLWFTDACQRDDVYVLNSNGTYQYNDAGVSCSPSESYDGTWSLSGNTMVIDGDPATIENFDCNVLVMTSSDIMVAGDRLKLTMTKQ